MIVKMKKITMIVSQRYREDFLVRLRSIGVVHVRHLTEPSSGELTVVEEEEALLGKVIFILSHYEPSPCAQGLGSSDLKEGPSLELTDGGILEVAEKIATAQKEKEELSRNIQDTLNKMVWYKPWGTFSLEDISELKKRGVSIKLYKLNKGDFKQIKNRKNVYVMGRESGYVYAAGLFYQSDEGFPVEEIKLPQESYEELKIKLERYNREHQEEEEFLSRHAIYKNQLEDFVKKLQSKHTFLNVFSGMKDERPLSVLQGFCPVTEVDKVVSLARENDFGYLVEEPDNVEETPTLIRNPKWVNIISPVFKFMDTMPGYSEYDISSIFLIFFSLFFAMLIGDAGYGLVIIGLTAFLRKKAKRFPPEPFRLMYLLGGATVIWGAVTGTWFGFEQIARLPFFNALVIEKISSFADNNQGFMIYICFIIGLVQLTIAHIMRFFRMINSLKALAQLGWIFTVWGLFFVAGTLVVNKPFPHFAVYLLVCGIALILVFSNPQKNILKGILTSLIDVPLTVISSFSDIVSYLRLFAVGYATVAVAASFNTMAMNTGFSSIIRGLGAAFILFFGHGLNILLGLMAVIVHGIRLNMLEFSGHLNMEWSGRKYVPFSESKV